MAHPEPLSTVPFAPSEERFLFKGYLLRTLASARLTYDKRAFTLDVERWLVQGADETDMPEFHDYVNAQLSRDTGSVRSTLSIDRVGVSFQKTHHHFDRRSHRYRQVHACNGIGRSASNTRGYGNGYDSRNPADCTFSERGAGATSSLISRDGL